MSQTCQQRRAGDSDRVNVFHWNPATKRFHRLTKPFLLPREDTLKRTRSISDALKLR